MPHRQAPAATSSSLSLPRRWTRSLPRFSRTSRRRPREMDSNMTDDNTDLEALFDSIAYGHTAAPAEEPASVPANETPACASEIAIRCAPENVSSCHSKLKPINCPGD